MRANDPSVAFCRPCVSFHSVLQGRETRVSVRTPPDSVVVDWRVCLWSPARRCLLLVPIRAAKCLVPTGYGLGQDGRLLLTLGTLHLLDSASVAPCGGAHLGNRPFKDLQGAEAQEGLSKVAPSTNATICGQGWINPSVTDRCERWCTRGGQHRSQHGCILA